MAKAKAKASKASKGTPVIVRHKEYRHSIHYGIVTEVFDSMIQIYGVDYHDDLGFHEYETAEITWVACEQKRVKFEIDQSIKEIERKKLSAELKYNQLKRDLEESVADVQKFFQ